MKNGVLGVMIVVISLMTTTFAGYILNVNPTEEIYTDYNYVSDINGLFEYSGSPQFAPYNPTKNITGYTNLISDTMNPPTGTVFNTTPVQNPYSVQTQAPVESIQIFSANDLRPANVGLREIDENPRWEDGSTLQGERQYSNRLVAAPDNLLNQQMDPRVPSDNLNPTETILAGSYSGFYYYSSSAGEYKLNQYILNYNYLTVQDIVDYIKVRYGSIVNYDFTKLDSMELTIDAIYTNPNNEDTSLQPFLFYNFQGTDGHMTEYRTMETKGTWGGLKAAYRDVQNIYNSKSNGTITIKYNFSTSVTEIIANIGGNIKTEPVANPSEWRLVYNFNQMQYTTIKFSDAPIGGGAYRVTDYGTTDRTMNNVRCEVKLLHNAKYGYVEIDKGTTLGVAEGTYERLTGTHTEIVTNPTDTTKYPTTTLTGTIGGENFSITGNAYIHTITSSGNRSELSISGPNIPEQQTVAPYIIAILDEGGNLMHVEYFRQETIWYAGIGTYYVFFNGTMTLGSHTDTITNTYPPYYVTLRVYETKTQEGYPGSLWSNNYDNSKIGQIITTSWDNNTGTIYSSGAYDLLMDFVIDKNYNNYIQGSDGDCDYLVRLSFAKEIGGNMNVRCSIWTNGFDDNTHETLVVGNHFLGKWNMFYVEMDVINKVINIYQVKDFINYVQYTIGAKVYTINLATYTDFWEGSDKYIYGMAYRANSQPLRWQIRDTEVWLNDYGAVMVNPSLNVLDYFTDYEDYRVYFQSTAVYGSKIQINGHVFDVDKNSIQLDTGRTDKYGNPIYQTHQLNNYYITVEDNKMFLTFVDDNKTYDLGVVTDPTIRFTGSWFFRCALYNGYTAIRDALNYTWNLAFDALQFVVISMGIGVLLFAYFYKTKNVKSFDILIVIFAIALGIGYLIACGDMVV